MVSGFPLAATDGFPSAPDDAGAEEFPAGGLDELLPLDPLLHAAALRARTESPAARAIRFMLDIPPLSECIRCLDVPGELRHAAAAASARDARASRGDRARARDGAACRSSTQFPRLCIIWWSGQLGVK
jgi:hypothetical protein